VLSPPDGADTSNADAVGIAAANTENSITIDKNSGRILFHTFVLIAFTCFTQIYLNSIARSLKMYMLFYFNILFK